MESSEAKIITARQDKYETLTDKRLDFLYDSQVKRDEQFYAYIEKHAQEHSILIKEFTIIAERLEFATKVFTQSNEKLEKVVETVIKFGGKIENLETKNGKIENIIDNSKFTFKEFLDYAWRIIVFLVMAVIGLKQAGVM